MTSQVVVNKSKLAIVAGIIGAVFLCALAVLGVTSGSGDGTSINSVVANHDVDRYVADIVPAASKSFTDCDELFADGTPAAGFAMSTEYVSRLAEFDAAVNRSTRDEQIEGYTFQQPKQYRALHYLAGRPTVSRICETGFNLGHSSFNFLTANSRAVVHSFDLGEHQYARMMAEVIGKMFPGRFNVHFGDSRQTIREFGRTHPDFECDLIYVDGGHTYDVAMADLLNLAAMARVEPGNIIIFDDYPTIKAFKRLFGWAWENMRRWGFIRETMRCSFRDRQYQRGFVVGQVVRRPTP